MTDIVKLARIGELQNFLDNQAAEIERLRAALQRIGQRYDREDGWPAEDMRDIARHALERKP